MNRRYKIMLLICCLTAALQAEEKETFTLESILVGADAMARGGTYLAVKNSSAPLFQNFAQTSGPRVSLSAFKLLSELNYLSAAYAQNGWALGFLTMQDSAGYNRDENNNLTGGQINYSDSTVYAAYGFGLDKLNLGLRLKYTAKSLGEIASARGFALDLAALYTLNAYWSLGAALNNASNTALHWSDGRAEAFPANGALGANYSVFGAQSNLNLSADLNFEKRDIFPSGGLEWRPVGLLALRVGFAQINILKNERETKQFKPTAGLGFDWLGVGFDYAYDPGDNLAENVTHFFTLSYRFYQPQVAPVETAKSENDSEQKKGRRRIYKDIYHLPMEDQLDVEDLGYLNLLLLDEQPE